MKRSGRLQLALGVCTCNTKLPQPVHVPQGHLAVFTCTAPQVEPGQHQSQPAAPAAAKRSKRFSSSLLNDLVLLAPTPAEGQVSTERQACTIANPITHLRQQMQSTSPSYGESAPPPLLPKFAASLQTPVHDPRDPHPRPQTHARARAHTHTHTRAGSPWPTAVALQRTKLLGAQPAQGSPGTGPTVLETQVLQAPRRLRVQVGKLATDCVEGGDSHHRIFWQTVRPLRPPLAAPHASSPRAAGVLYFRGSRSRDSETRREHSIADRPNQTRQNQEH